MSRAPEQTQPTRDRVIPNEIANKVAKVTTIAVLREVHTALLTMPARDFDAWLLQRMGQAERMP